MWNALLMHDVQWQLVRSFSYMEQLILEDQDWQELGAALRVSKNAKNVQKGFKAIQNCFHFGGELYLLCVFVVNPIWLKTKKKKHLK